MTWLKEIYCINKYSAFIWMILNKVLRITALKMAQETSKFAPATEKLSQILWNLP